MTRNEINIVILEYLGWRSDIKMQDGTYIWDIWPDGRIWGSRPNGDNPYIAEQVAPDFYDNLNACHEVEESLTEVQRRAYERILCRVVGHRDMGDPMVEMYDFDLLHAKSSHRATAIVHLLGKFTE